MYQTLHNNDFESIKYMNYDVIINGLETHAHYSEKSINEIYIPLLKRLTAMQKEAGRRILIMLAAPPGAGKSTMLSFLKYLSENTEGVAPIETIGMDGFHHYQDYLLTHETERAGEKIMMVKVKGAPETFDLDLLKERVARVASGEECGWPIYDRLKHNPEDNVILVKGDIVLLEGNYLLLKDKGWCELKDYADYTIRITAKEEQIRSRLVERKIMTGVDREAAEAFVDSSDLYNARICLNSSAGADLELMLMDDDEYMVWEQSTEKYILNTAAGTYIIERVIDMDDKKFFTLFNLDTGNVMFGEYEGELPPDEDEAREIIWKDFLDGCPHISYPDGYIVDDLYEMIDFF